MSSKDLNRVRQDRPNCSSSTRCMVAGAIGGAASCSRVNASRYGAADSSGNAASKTDSAWPNFIAPPLSCPSTENSCSAVRWARSACTSSADVPGQPATEAERGPAGHAEREPSEAGGAGNAALRNIGHSSFCRSTRSVGGTTVTGVMRRPAASAQSPIRKLPFHRPTQRLHPLTVEEAQAPGRRRPRRWRRTTRRRRWRGGAGGLPAGSPASASTGRARADQIGTAQATGAARHDQRSDHRPGTVDAGGQVRQ